MAFPLELKIALSPMHISWLFPAITSGSELTFISKVSLVKQPNEFVAVKV